MNKKILAIAIALSISGCVAVPELHTDKIHSKSQFVEVNKSINWWAIYNDPNLNALIDIAFKENRDIRISNIKISKITEQYNISESANNLNATLSATPQKEILSKNSFTPSSSAGKIIDNQKISLDTQYTVDLLHQIDNLKSETVYNKEAEELSIMWNKINLSNQIIKLYAYRGYLDDEKDVLNNQKQLYQRLLTLEKNKVSVGIGVKDDILKLETAINVLEKNISINKLNTELTDTSILLLVSNNKEAKSILEKDTNKIYRSNLKAPSSISSDSIINRPDIAYYLAVINSKKANLAYLKTNFYPSFSINGSIGFESITPSLLLSKSSVYAAFSPSISLPILDAGKIKANYKIAGLDLNIFIQNYNQSVDQAFSDINKNLYKANQKEIEHIREADTYEKEQELFLKMKSRYGLGKISKDELLNKELNFSEKELTYLSSSLSNFNQKVDLINALGGKNIINNK